MGSRFIIVGEPVIFIVMFNPFINICVDSRSNRTWGYCIYIDVHLQIVFTDGRLNKVCIVEKNDSELPNKTEKISKLCYIKNIIKTTLENLRKVLK